MNDCLWKCIGGCNKDCKCKSYISMNSNEGQGLSAKWQEVVDEALNQRAIRFADANGFKESEGEQ